MELKEGMRVKLKFLDKFKSSDFEGPPGIVPEMRKFDDPANFNYLIRWIDDGIKMPKGIQRMI